MNNRKMLLIIIFLALGVVVGGVTYLSINNGNKGNNTDNKVLETDAQRFKREYESLNNTIRESDGAKYNNVEVLEDNPMVYIDCKEALDILENKDAIIYVGAPWCPWCRNAVPILIDMAKQYNIKTIHYLDLDEEKSIWEVGNGKAIKKIDGTKYYYQLLEKLADHLKDYNLKDEKGKNVKTGEKRIYMPYVIGFKKGKIVAEHSGTVDLNDNQTKYDSLTDKQRKELTKAYNILFDEVYKEATNSCEVGLCG